MSAPALRLLGGQVLRGGALRDGDLSLAAGRIVAEGGRALDLRDCILLPGMVDAHGDGFERHVAPRRGMVAGPGEGFGPLAVELAASGITTACLAQFWSWAGGLRGPDFAQALAVALRDWTGPVDLRMQLRVETHMIADFNAIARFVRREGIAHVVFNDHLPHDLAARGTRPERLTGAALRARRSPEEHWRILRALSANGPEVATALPRLIAELPPVTLGSHDDDAAARARFAEMGVGIAEFPVERAAASGDVVLGAPNVVRGGSHGRGIAAAGLIAEGRCTALASDYHYPAMLGAVRRLVAEGMALAAAWALVSSAPAGLLRLADRGALEPGMRADVVALDTRDLTLAATFAAGWPIWLRPDIAARMIG